MKKAFLITALTFAAVCTVAGIIIFTSVTNDELKEKFNYEDNHYEYAGEDIADELDFSNFHSIETEGNVMVVYMQDSTWRVEVAGKEELVMQYAFEESDGVLSVKKKNHKGQVNTGMRSRLILTIFAPTLRNIEMSGAGSFKSELDANLDNDLSIETNGACDIDIATLTCKDLRIETSGACDIDLQNATCNNAYIESNGAGDIDATIRSLADIFVETSGAGDIDLEVDCAGTLTAEATGAGEIELKGTTKRLKKSSSIASHIDVEELTVVGK